LRLITPKKFAPENENRISIGSVVEYEQHGAPVLGVVVSQKKDKWTVLNTSGGQLDLPPLRLTLLPGRAPEESKDNAAKLKYLAQIESQAAELVSKLDLSEAWELLSEEGREVTSHELAELVLNSVELVPLIAIRRALLGEQVYFKRKKTTFEPRPSETVMALRAQFEAEQGKKRQREHLVEALAARIKDRSVSLPPTVSLIERYAALGKSAEDAKEALEVVEEALSRANVQLGQKAHERAFQLLVLAGHFTEDENLSLFRLGREKRFPPAITKEAEEVSERLEEVCNDSKRDDYRSLLTFTIDSAGTLDCDDALSIEQTVNGFRIGIHIADVSATVPQGSALEKEAFGRATSIYTADAHIPMFPPVLSENALSLAEQKVRPAQSFFIETDEHFQVIGRDVRLTVIEVKRKLSYEEVDRMLFEETTDPELRAAMSKLWDATCAFEAKRLQAGALQFSRREMNAKIQADGSVSLEENSEDTPAHKLVSEMMILANETAALFAESKQLPMIFRSQEAPDVNPEEQGMDIAEGPARDFFRRSFLKRSVTSAYPAPHYGLGLPAYLQITSPIRRAADLINQRQLSEFVRNGKPLFTGEQLVELLGSLEAGLDEAMQIQRERNRYFLLKYLIQENIKEIGAMILKTDGPKPLAELDTIFMLAPFHAATDMKALDAARKRRGERIRLMVESINPRTDTLILREIPQG